MKSTTTAKKQFFGLTDLDHSDADSDSLMDQFTMHKKLLEVYYKLHQIM